MHSASTTSYLWRARSRAAAVVLCAIALYACVSAGKTDSLSSPSTARSSEAPTDSGNLPRPISCETWVVGAQQLNQQMPDHIIRAIAEGKGLPSQFYSSKTVSADFCRPVNGVWTFPDSQQHFYNAETQALIQQKVSAGDRRTIQSIVHRTPAAGRIFIKWMYSRDGLIVFSMKPTNTGIWMSGGSPYVVLNKDEIVTPDGGEVGPPPPGTSIR
jgi:hypothetical protein